MDVLTDRREVAFIHERDSSAGAFMKTGGAIVYGRLGV